MLSQKGKDGEVHVITYASRSLRPSERSMHDYSSAKIELMALKWSVCKKFKDYRSGTVNSNTVNSKFHLIRSYCEIFFYHFPNISCLKCTVNSNFHLIQSKILLTKDFKLTVPNLYLLGSKFTIFTDNNPLVYVKTSKLGAAQIRWLSKLALYDFDIVYRTGRSNLVAVGQRLKVKIITKHVAIMMTRNGRQYPIPPFVRNYKESSAG